MTRCLPSAVAADAVIKVGVEIFIFIFVIDSGLDHTHK
jgi:hypothetical protein